ncbi:DVU_1555 family C-GCAxxG-C-C protein [Desulfolutivibrio sulfoxidireducens]|uniref:DVU_1555 family C-GCAxxG-C-C protein n=1 Tax=Desulfolutivibrio sulfoxidireducens TaxID=2773299 RepID=UPI00159E9B2A|nr:DV_1555 family C-GCAxxG-C-C protein [Desulfolutivibrio sulfoxidireducens]QLA15493.1 hypothetical protein GD605_04730 [Desulfolutivibrio sulfoxidireducens]
MTSSLDILPLVGRGYCCSQALALLALEAQGRENPELVRALSGLCRGLAGSGGTCGILTGGCCVLALYVGKGADAEQPHPMAEPVVADFVDWFREKTTAAYGGDTCPAIMGENQPGGPYPAHCGELLAESFDRILEILASYGIDPSQPKEDV